MGRGFTVQQKDRSPEKLTAEGARHRLTCAEEGALQLQTDRFGGKNNCEQGSQGGDSTGNLVGLLQMIADFVHSMSWETGARHSDEYMFRVYRHKERHSLQLCRKSGYCLPKSVFAPLNTLTFLTLEMSVASLFDHICNFTLARVA